MATTTMRSQPDGEESGGGRGLAAAGRRRARTTTTSGDDRLLLLLAIVYGRPLILVIGTWYAKSNTTIKYGWYQESLNHNSGESQELGGQDVDNRE